MTARKRILSPPPKRQRVRHKRGGQPGNENAFKHGRFTHEIRALKADVWAFTRRVRVLIEEAKQFRRR
jgi:hypothetical protein